MKALLLGANGQLGRTFLSHGGLATRVAVTAATRDGKLVESGQAAKADLSAPETLVALLAKDLLPLILKENGDSFNIKAGFAAFKSERLPVLHEFCTSLGFEQHHEVQNTPGNFWPNWAAVFEVQ